MRIVIDTDVVVAALRSAKGASRAVIQGVRSGMFGMTATATMFVEYEAVLKRPANLQAAGLSPADVDAVLDALASLCIPATPYFLWRPQLRDPGDEMMLEAAVAGGADAIVTFNRRDYGDAPKRFGVSVLTPAEALLIRRRI